MAGNLQRQNTSYRKNHTTLLDGKTLLLMLQKAHNKLKEHVELINSINVFPVPDSDTGINMFQTFRKIVAELARVDSDDLGTIITAATNGAFNGGTGNSGIILAEYFAGLEKIWKDQGHLDGELLAEGLNSGTEAAYLALDNPREGTILTITRVVSEVALECSITTNNPVKILLNVFEESRKALIATYIQLPRAHEAGVVDAGALGFVLILEGFIEGLLAEELPYDHVPVTTDKELLPFLVPDINHFDDIETEWELQFYISDLKEPLAIIKNELSKEGNSLVVVYNNESSKFKVHIHTKHPKRIMDDLDKYAGFHEIISLQALHHQCQSFLKRIKKQVLQ